MYSSTQASLSSSMYSQTRPVKTYLTQVPRGFTVQVVSGPTLSSFPYTATAKFDHEYNGYAHHNTGQRQPWYSLPSWSTTSKAYSKNTDASERHSSSTSPSFDNPPVPEKDQMRMSNAPFPIYSTISKHSYTYGTSLSRSKSESDSNDGSETSSTTTLNASSPLSPALSTDSTSTRASSATLYDESSSTGTRHMTHSERSSSTFSTALETPLPPAPSSHTISLPSTFDESFPSNGRPTLSVRTDTQPSFCDCPLSASGSDYGFDADTLRNTSINSLSSSTLDSVLAPLPDHHAPQHHPPTYFDLGFAPHPPQSHPTSYSSGATTTTGCFSRTFSESTSEQRRSPQSTLSNYGSQYLIPPLGDWDIDGPPPNGHSASTGRPMSPTSQLRYGMSHNMEPASARETVAERAPSRAGRPLPTPPRLTSAASEGHAVAGHHAFSLPRGQNVAGRVRKDSLGVARFDPSFHNLAATAKLPSDPEKAAHLPAPIQPSQKVELGGMQHRNGKRGNRSSPPSAVAQPANAEEFPRSLQEPRRAPSAPMTAEQIQRSKMDARASLLASIPPAVIRRTELLEQADARAESARLLSSDVKRTKPTGTSVSIPLSAQPSHVDQTRQQASIPHIPQVGSKPVQGNTVATSNPLDKLSNAKTTAAVIYDADPRTEGPPQRRHSDGDQNPVTYRSVSPVQSLPDMSMHNIGGRCVRWTENLICPSPITASKRRKGWFNRRGDQLWTNSGLYKPCVVGEEFPPDLDSYPEYGEGWMNEDGVRIDMVHRLVPKIPLRSALKQSRK